MVDPVMLILLTIDVEQRTLGRLEDVEDRLAVTADLRFADRLVPHERGKFHAASQVRDNFGSNSCVDLSTQRRFCGAHQIFQQLGVGVDCSRRAARRLDHRQRSQRKGFGRVAGRILHHAIASGLRQPDQHIHPLAGEQHRLFDPADIGTGQPVHRNLPHRQRRPAAVLLDPFLLVGALDRVQVGRSIVESIKTHPDPLARPAVDQPPALIGSDFRRLQYRLDLAVDAGETSRIHPVPVMLEAFDRAGLAG